MKVYFKCGAWYGPFQAPTLDEGKDIVTRQVKILMTSTEIGQLIQKLVVVDIVAVSTDPLEEHETILQSMLISLHDLKKHPKPPVHTKKEPFVNKILNFFKI